MTEQKKGRPCKLTDGGIEEAERMARAGATHRSIARVLCVSTRAFDIWKRRGRDEQDRVESVEERIGVIQARVRLGEVTEAAVKREIAKLTRQAKPFPHEDPYFRLVRALGIGSGRFEMDMLTYARAGAAKKHPELALKLLAVRGGEEYRPQGQPSVAVNISGDGNQSLQFSGSLISDADMHDAAAMVTRRSMERRNAMRVEAETDIAADKD